MSDDDQKIQDAAIDAVIARESQILAAADTAEAAYARASAEFDRRTAELEAKYAAMPDASSDDYTAEYRAIEKEIRETLDEQMEKMVAPYEPTQSDESFA